MALSYFHGLLTKGYLEVLRDSVSFTKKLSASLEYDHFQGHFQQPYEIANTQNVFYDHKLKHIIKSAASPQIVVACLYTLKVSNLIGQQFSTVILKDSGLCPQQFQAGVSLNNILDILEENDFIEMIDQKGEERCYRFIHSFL